MENTHEDFGWLTNSLETWLSAEIWKTCTVATIARFYRKVLDNYCDKTGGIKELVDWQAHDFSMRGMSNVVDAAYAGIGHLLYFTGSDSVPAVIAASKIYDTSDCLVGGSVPATEHSVASSYYLNSGNDTSKSDSAYVSAMLDKYPSGIVSIVSDTFDYFRLISEIASEHKEKILNRVPDQFGIAKTVFRPDSGDPVNIICGDKSAPEGSLQRLGSLQILWDIFGGTVTKTGHRLLNPRVGLIYGDSITPQRMLAILERMCQEGWCSSNLVFGVGSYTYQHITRDTLGFAMKATAINGTPIFKDPKTDSGTKKSARGLLTVQNGKLVEHENYDSYYGANDELLEYDPHYGKKLSFSAMRAYALQEVEDI
jgi:nicotinamide phosphoribosyltransferase